LICLATFWQRSELVELGCRLELGLGAAAPGLAPGCRGETARLLDGLLQQFAGLLGQREDLGLRLAGAPTNRPRDAAQPMSHRPRPIAHPHLGLA